MTRVFDYLARHRKAIVGFVAPGISSLAVALTTGDQHVSGHEWAMAGLACVVTAVGVGSVRNRAERD